MEVVLRSAVSGDVIGKMKIAETDTIETIRADVCRALAVDTMHHQVELVTPHQVRDIIDGGEVSVLIRRANEVEVTVESCDRCTCCQCQPWMDQIRPVYWSMDYVRDRFETVRRRTGCSACNIDAHADNEDDWRAVRFRGTPAEVESAENAIKAFMEIGHTPLFCEFGNSIKHRLSVSLETLSALEELMLTYTGGLAYRPDYRLFSCELSIVMGILRHLSSVLGVSLTCGGGRHRKKQIVSIAGSVDGVTKAVASLKHLFMYYHNEYVLPNVDHMELTLPLDIRQAFLSSLVCGSELRHISRNWRVDLVLPLEHSLNPNVVILGEKSRCKAAHAYMSRLLMEFIAHAKCCQRLGWTAVEQWGLSDEAYDFWGEEQEDEPWMAPYMYRRT